LPYTPYARLLADRGFPDVKVRKVTLNGGFTCPNIDGTKSRGGCTFCDNRSFSPSAGNRGLSIPLQLEQGIAYARARFGAERFIAYFQTFSGTYAPVARLRELYQEALGHSDVVGLSIGTRPDCVDPKVADLLEEVGRKTFLTLELGLQSSFDESLRNVNRAHTFEDFTRAMDLCQDRGFDLCVHVILGLPGETREHYRHTAASLNRWRYQAIKIHPLHVVRGTVLAEQYARGEYQCLEIEEYVGGLVDFLERVPTPVGVQRFTGDARGELLVAPMWCREKSKVLEMMKSEFKRRGSRQGFRLDKPCSVFA
jgi:radical SAM protein (TIGR01212 family)